MVPCAWISFCMHHLNYSPLSRLLSLLDQSYPSQCEPDSNDLPAPPIHFAALPEYLLDDLAGLLVFLSRYGLKELKQADLTPVVHLFFLLLSRYIFMFACSKCFLVHMFFFCIRPNHLTNPYLRSTLVEVLCAIGPFLTNHGKLEGCLPVLFSLFIQLVSRTWRPCSREHTGL